MTILQRAMGLLMALVMVASGLFSTSDAWAQAIDLTPRGASSSTTPPPATTTPPASRQGYVALADFGVDNPADLDDPNRPVPRSLTPPSPATTATISGTTPVVNWQECVQRFGAVRCGALWTPMQTDNERLCTKGASAMKEYGVIQASFGTDEEDLKFLQSVYEELDPQMRRATRVMQASQAIQAGFLCVLSLGSYCIAAVAGAAGNIYAAEANLKLQLAHIKVAIVNIIVTRKNLRLSALHVELVGMWIPAFMPACLRMGYITPEDIIATERTAMDPVSSLDSPVLQRDRERRSRRDSRRDRRGWNPFD